MIVAFEMLTAGQRLRALREELGLTIRQVEAGSERIAMRQGNEDFAISPSRLADIESKGTLPNVFRMYSLAVIYGRDFREIAGWYGVELDDRALFSERDSAALNLVFDFPAPIKSACEQYLLYFVQFLSDLGIEANAEVKEQASKVLFSVTPVDEKQALEKIREALHVYLGLPLTAEFARVAGKFHDVAVTQLQANVLHLQSQIVLAKAALEMKNAALDAKDAQIALLQDRIDLRVFQPQSEAKETDGGKEELVKDVLSVKKYDLKFLEINFPELLRKLKRKIK